MSQHTYSRASILLRLGGTCILKTDAVLLVAVALQALAVTPFTCVYVSATIHMARLPGIFPFNGNIRAMRAIHAAEGVGGLFKGAFPLMWAHVLAAYVRVIRCGLACGI